MTRPAFVLLAGLALAALAAGLLAQHATHAAMRGDWADYDAESIS